MFLRTPERCCMGLDQHFVNESQGKTQLSSEPNCGDQTMSGWPVMTKEEQTGHGPDFVLGFDVAAFLFAIVLHKPIKHGLLFLGTRKASKFAPYPVGQSLRSEFCDLKSDESGKVRVRWMCEGRYFSRILLFKNLSQGFL